MEERTEIFSTIIIYDKIENTKFKNYKTFFMD